METAKSIDDMEWIDLEEHFRQNIMNVEGVVYLLGLGAAGEFPLNPDKVGQLLDDTEDKVELCRKAFAQLLTIHLELLRSSKACGGGRKSQLKTCAE
ncbi:MAG: hypothetical protein HQK57_03945 [Deltaproteobacteria bacterium]|nr:hypothetical protein [Deltaproteobacteria bacterium]